MPKVKSSAAYRAADTLNKQLKAMYDKFGEDSEMYQLYVNKLTAALPGQTHISKSGVLQVSKSKTSGLTAQQIKTARKGLPSVSRATSTYKRQIAEERLGVVGNAYPSESEIQRAAKGVTQEDIRKFVDAKSYVKDKEDSRGKLRYDASVSDLMSVKGAKSYELLAAILEEGEKRSNAEAQKEADTAATVEQGYTNGKAQFDNQRAKAGN